MSLEVEPAPTEAWDSKALGRPAILAMGESYWMWYPGIDSRAKYALGLAVSTDGMHWTRVDERPVLTAQELPWDSLHSILDPCIVRADDRLLLWAVTQGPRATTEICLLTSRDGIHWEPLGDNSVFGPAADQEWERLGLVKPSVVFDGRQWHLWYASVDPGQPGIGHAVSGDGLTWRRPSAGPALRPEPGGWDSVELTDPWVVYHEGLYHLWYTGAGPDLIRRIGHAVSPDGHWWQRSSSDPALVADPARGLETGGVFAPVVLREASRWLMWYGSAQREADGYRGFLNVAVSDDGLMWTRTSDEPVFRPSPHGFYMNPA